MARPAKQKAEYFPHFVGSGKTIRALERRYGNDGYAFWFKLLETVCDTEGHCLDLSDPVTMIDFSGYVHMEEDQVVEIIGFLVRLGKVDNELWSVNNRVWIQGLVDNLAPLYAKRANPPQKPSTSAISVAETPQKKEKESKGDEEEDARVCAREEPATDWSTAQVVDPEWLRVSDCYLANIGLLPEGGRRLDTLLSYYDDLGADVLIAAIEHTNLQDAKNPWTFLMAVLKDWAASNVSTAEQAKAAILDHKRKIGATKTERNGNTSLPQAPVPRAMVDIRAEQARRGDKPRDPPKLPAGPPGGSP